MLRRQASGADSSPKSESRRSRSSSADKKPLKTKRKSENESGDYGGGNASSGAMSMGSAEYTQKLKQPPGINIPHLNLFGVNEKIEKQQNAMRAVNPLLPTGTPITGPATARGSSDERKRKSVKTKVSDASSDDAAPRRSKTLKTVKPGSAEGRPKTKKVLASKKSEVLDDYEGDAAPVKKPGKSSPASKTSKAIKSGRTSSGAVRTRKSVDGLDSDTGNVIASSNMKTGKLTFGKKIRRSQADIQAETIMKKIKTREAEHRTSPVQRLQSLHGDMSEVISAIEKLQNENLQLRVRAMTQIGFVFQQWMDADNRSILANTFMEWKKILYKKRSLALVENAISETRSEEQAKAIEARTQESEKLNIDHQRKLREMSDQLNMEFQKRHELLSNEFQSAMDSMRLEFDTNIHNLQQSQEHEKLELEMKRTSIIADHEREKGDLEIELGNVTLQLQETKKLLKEREARLGNAERCMNVIKNSVMEFDPTLLEQEMEMIRGEIGENAQTVPGLLGQQTMPPDDSALTYVKNALHEVLYAVDPRYLGKSQMPTVREIALLERAAYDAAIGRIDLKNADPAGSRANSNNSSPRIASPRQVSNIPQFISPRQLNQMSANFQQGTPGQSPQSMGRTDLGDGRPRVDGPLMKPDNLVIANLGGVTASAIEAVVTGKSPNQNEYVNSRPFEKGGMEKGMNDGKGAMMDKGMMMDKGGKPYDPEWERRMMMEKGKGKDPEMERRLMMEKGMMEKRQGKPYDPIMTPQEGKSK